MKNYYEVISWVDEYIRNVAPYIHVRSYDNLLIKIPNEAYKLNDQGLKVLAHLLGGGGIYDIVDSYDNPDNVAKDLHLFFCDLKAVLKGCYSEKEVRGAIEKKSFDLPYNTLPVLSEIALTYRCNLACKFCYSSCGCKKNDEIKELGTDEIKKILKIIRQEVEIPSVSFTGGEPTLRKDLVKLIRYAKSLGMWTNLISNGTLLTSELVKRLKEAGLDSAQISVEGGIGNIHDRIVGSNGAFKRAIQGIINLRDCGIRVHTNTTISGMNRTNLDSILDLVKSLKLDRFSMNMLTPQGSALKDFEDLQITYSEIGQIVLDINKKALQMGLEFMWYSPTPVCIFNPIVHGLGNKGCAACDGLLSISPNGDILPCSSYFESVGNILDMEGKFRESWADDNIKYFQSKKFAHSMCQSCEHLAVCNGACPLYWGKLGYDEIIDLKKEI